MNKPRNHSKQFLFTVDIVIDAMSNGTALEKLHQLLNRHPDIRDYKIQKGIEVGQLIDEIRKLLEENTGKQVPNANKPQQQNTLQANQLNNDRQILNMLEHFKNNNTLVRMSILKQKGLQLSLPCRIINLDSVKETVTVYHVDEKKVYQFNLTEIEDFTVN